MDIKNIDSLRDFNWVQEETQGGFQRYKKLGQVRGREGPAVAAEKCSLIIGQANGAGNWLHTKKRL